MLSKKEDYAWRTGRKCVFKNFVHLVFVTKNRREVFSKEMIDTMQEVFQETTEQMGCELIEFEGEDDHVHLMLSYPPKLALSNLVGKLKGKSSYVLRKNYWPQLKEKLWEKHLWSSSYCVVSCGGAPLETVRQYIEEQRVPASDKSIRQSLQEKGRKGAKSRVKTKKRP